MAKAGRPPKADSLDEQISSLLESIGVNGNETEGHEHRVQEAPARRHRRERRASGDSAKASAPRGKAPPAWKASRAYRRPPAKAHAHTQPRSRARPRPRRELFADPAMRELAFFVLAGLMIGAVVGVLFALMG